MLRAEIITSFREFQKCKSLYDTLLAQMETGKDNVFDLYNWHEIYLKTYKCFLEPLVIKIYEDDSPVAVFPMCVRKRSKYGLLYYYIEYLGAEACNYSDFLISPESNRIKVFMEFFKTLRNHWKPFWLYLVFPPIQANSPDANAFIETQVYFPLKEENLFTVAPFIRIEGNWDWYFRSYIDKKCRDDLKRLMNRVRNEIGDLILEEASPEELEQFFQMHTNQWKSHGEKGRYSIRENREFDKELVEKFEFMDFLKLKFGKSTVAYHLGYRYKGHFSYYRPTFDLQFSRFSPGKILLAKLIERETKRGTEIFDLGRGRQEYKYWFGKSELPIVTIQFYNNGLIYAILRLYGHLIKLLKVIKLWK